MGKGRGGKENREPSRNCKVESRVAWAGRWESILKWEVGEASRREHEMPINCVNVFRLHLMSNE